MRVRVTSVARTALVAGVVLLSMAGPVLAHEDSSAALTQTAGPYQLLTYDGTPAPGEGDVDYTVLVQDRDGRPVDGADVTVTARSTATSAQQSGAVGPVTARAVANVYRFTLPDPAPAAWDVAVTVSAGAGQGVANFTLHAPMRRIEAVATTDPLPRRAGPPPGLVILGGAVVVLAIFGLTIGRPAKVTSPDRTDVHA